MPVDFACPSCGQDLYARPPRTYFEMEGFVEAMPVHAGHSLARRLGALVRVLAEKLGACGLIGRERGIRTSDLKPAVHPDGSQRTSGQRKKGGKQTADG